MTSPLSLTTLGMLSPSGGGGGNVYLTGGTEVSVNLQMSPVNISLEEVSVNISSPRIDVTFNNDDLSPVGLQFDEIAVSS